MGLLEIADIAEVAAVAQQLRDGAVDADRRQAVKVEPGLDGGGPAEIGEQQVGGIIVAMDQHPAHQRVGAGPADAVVEAAATMVDLRQIGSRDRQLDRARHREALFAVDADLLAVAEVERGDAIFAAAPRHQARQLLFERDEFGRGHRHRGLGGEGRQEQKQG